MNPTPSLRQELLYHKIHPLKLAVGLSTSCVSTWLFGGTIWLLGFWWHGFRQCSSLLPTGIQIYADLWREDHCLSAAGVIEAGVKLRSPVEPVR